MGQTSEAPVESTRDSDRLSLRSAASPDGISECRDTWIVAALSPSGVALRDDFVRESDIDALSEFEPGSMPGIEFVRMASELSCQLGRPVDVVTRPIVARSPSYLRREEIQESARAIDAASGTYSLDLIRGGAYARDVYGRPL